MTIDIKTTRRAVLGGGALLAISAIPGFAATPFASRRIAVTVRGTGRDVLLIPGLASGPGIWNGAITSVSGYRYHLVQVRGFAGLPPDLNKTGPLIAPLADEIARYMSSMGLARPAVVGHSMGGTLAMMLALRGAAGRAMVIDMLPEGAGMIGGTASGMGYLADQLGQYFTGTKAGRDMFAEMLARQPGAKGSDPDVIAKALTELAHTDLGPQLGKLAVPLRVLYAVPSDARIRASLVQQFRAAYAAARNAVLTPIGPSGHMVMADQPKLFTAALSDFLKGI
ncbi:alpha/beta hydrolase [Sphingobium phenoxybenzoativorans]|uniref:Alpha/beta hydrolase n=1 Tax=Sphingobium phenoxybenzoativorans TaxID=1592790 RepID=A0A975Q0W1_9SPHN|nr:alpha/beta hydrolase [Sphingobium phenoxybenzoativorans]QUT04783.1 alpha/beta hydrolase [Sphingobium phenoxybenzoativorans]